MVMPIAMVRGFGAADVEVNLKRARELSDQAGAPATLGFQVVHGLFGHYSLLANFELARSLAGQDSRPGSEARR
jgi:hypothetical protein